MLLLKVCSLCLPCIGFVARKNCLCMPRVKNILKLRNKEHKILIKSCREMLLYLDLAQCAFAFMYPRSV